MIDRLTFLSIDDRTCVAIVDIRGAPAVESWYRIWEEMVAIEGMCARNGLDGTAYALGKLSNGSLVVRPSAIAHAESK